MKDLIVRFCVLVVFFCGINSAIAQMCESYIAQTVKPMTYDAVEKIVSEVPEEKGEFETTAAFNERVAAFGLSLPNSFLVGYDLIGADPLKYDADSQHMKISSYGLTGYADYYRDKGYGVMWGANKDINDKWKSVFRDYPLDIVVSEAQKVTGRYKGSNALGASVTVKEITKTTNIIFERDLNTNEDMFATQQDKNYNFRIPMSVEEAKALKKQANAAALIVPMAPYFYKDWGVAYPTFSSPTKVIDKFLVVVANIQCVFLLDRTNKVASVFEVN